MLLILAALAVFAFEEWVPFDYPAFGLALILLLLAVLLSSMLITVDDKYLRWSFGPGFIGKRVPLEDIRLAQRVRLRWYRSWGIRRTRNGWLYNVTGRRAVLIKLKSGKQFILGCDKPDHLVRTLLDQFSAQS